MKCPICKRVELDPGEGCCMECERIDQFIQDTPPPSATNGAYTAPVVTVQGCIDCVTKAAMYDGRCLGCDRIFKDKQREVTMPVETVERTKPLCIKCKEAPIHARKMCARCWSRAKRDGEFTPGVGGMTNKKNGQDQGVPVQPQQRKTNAEPDAVTLLKDRAKELRDEAYAAADAQYEKVLAAIELVADLTRGS